VKRCTQPIKEEPEGEDGKDAGFGNIEPSGNAGGVSQTNGAASGGNDWENNGAEVSTFGGPTPIAATGGW
jgi:hypothetical protein